MYVGADDHNVYALNASTGAKLWSYATGGAVQSSPAVANGVLYIGSTDDNVYAFGLKGRVGSNVIRRNRGGFQPPQPARQQSQRID